MNNDPDIIRWSQIKRALLHFLGWAFVYLIIGWGTGMVNKVYETNTHGAQGWQIIVLWLVISAICTPLTLKSS